jgi:hypothetical protein
VDLDRDASNGCEYGCSITNDADEICDGLDNDCDGSTDEGQPQIACGVGECRRQVASCVGGVPQSCVAGAAAAETCDGLDNDCDGVSDDYRVSCYTGAAGTEGVGTCSAGTRLCAGSQWGACQGEVKPATDACNAKDDDCDGQTDEDLGSTTCGVGECTRTVANCAAGRVQSCAEGAPSAETCDGLDNDCDGVTDGVSRACYTGAGATRGVGACRDGAQVCTAGGWGACAGEKLPEAESCNGADDDCDGATDLIDRACYSGDPATRAVGECADGVQRCTAAVWGACAGETLPATEVCDGVRDDDCDGTPDDGCACVNGTSRSCYTGPAGTAGKGICKAGTQQCSGGGWGACSGEVTPGTETCDAKDNDCDTATDEGLGTTTCGVGECRKTVQNCIGGAAQTCAPGAPSVETCDNKDNNCDGTTDNFAQACYTGTAATRGVGECRDGTQTCTAGGWGACGGEKLPGVESCDAKDNDCDAATDEGLGSTTCGIGECARTVQNCVGGAVQSCVEGAPAPETCDNKDNDCDGTTDGNARACYTGAAATRGVGECRDGSQVCSAGGWGACGGEKLPAAESCDNKDNDCDGTRDDGNPGGGVACATGVPGECATGVTACTAGALACTQTVFPAAEVCNNKDDDCDGQKDEDGAGAALVQSCYTGAAGTLGVGVCAAGTQACSAGAWGACAGQVTPSAEVCDNKDNDCNGSKDGISASCYTGAAGTSGVGECRAGSTLCTAGAWGACSGQVLPATETCDNKDNDCDAATDETLAQACYTGTAATRGVGECRDGSQSCSAGAWGACGGQVLPAAETCDNKDNDCDGAKDESLTQACYGGAAATRGVGECRDGAQTCAAGAWGACGGQVLPAAETCDNKDNDCDAATDESLTLACYTGAAATRGVGECRDGAQTCAAGAWGACSGQLLPAASESCDGKDNDCDATTDEGNPGGGAACAVGGKKGECANGTTQCTGGALACNQTIFPSSEICDNKDNDCDSSTDESLTQACYTGPVATRNVGVCSDGSQTCAAGAWGACSGQVLPGSEMCNTADDDCDGATDESLCKPTANAGPDQTVAPLANVSLDGRSSTNSCGGSLSYAWRMVSQPSGSTSTLSGATSAQPSFYADIAGDFTIELVVTSSSNGCASSADTVVVHVVPQSRVHIQLTWAETYGDVDLHYVAPSGTPFDCSFGDGSDCFWCAKTPDWGLNNTGQPDGNKLNDPSLDVDDLWGSGPENINQDVVFNGKYTVAVNYYCSRRSTGPTTTNYGTARATVRVYIDGVLALTNGPQALGQRDYWEAAEVTANNGSISVRSLNSLKSTNDARGGCTADRN